MTVTLKPHDIIYYEDPWTTGIIKAEIIDIKDTPFKGFVKVHDICYVDKNGNETYKCGGTRGICIANIYTSCEKAYNARNKKANEAVKDYCKAINSVEELVRFPLQHCLNGEKYTDYNTVKAYKIRANELLGVEL